MLLLDTCSLLWLVSDPSRFSERGRDLIARSAGALFVSGLLTS